mmetsp:Transcript_64720/g.179475  ORF Transcript_64720/g.179475 Transcript_64720/m.179475 type:complete len:223 (-) Transcript_64720:29-697(-)
MLEVSTSTIMVPSMRQAMASGATKADNEVGHHDTTACLTVGSTDDRQYRPTALKSPESAAPTRTSVITTFLGRHLPLRWHRTAVLAASRRAARPWLAGRPDSAPLWTQLAAASPKLASTCRHRCPASRVSCTASRMKKQAQAPSSMAVGQDDGVPAGSGWWASVKATMCRTTHTPYKTAPQLSLSGTATSAKLARLHRRLRLPRGPAVVGPLDAPRLLTDFV